MRSLQLVQLDDECVRCLALLLRAVPHGLCDLEGAGESGDGTRRKGENDLQTHNRAA